MSLGENESRSNIGHSTSVVRDASTAGISSRRDYDVPINFAWTNTSNNVIVSQQQQQQPSSESMNIRKGAELPDAGVYV